MTSANPVEVTTPSEREVTVTRVFGAPRALVFDAFTRQELVKRWLWGPDDWPLAVCEIDLRVGGAMRYVWRNPEKGDMGMSGTFREIVPPERTVHTELFDEDWTGGEVVVTTVFTEAAGRTTVAMTILYASREARDGALRTGMAEGMGQSYDRLDGMLAAMAG